MRELYLALTALAPILVIVAAIWAVHAWAMAWQNRRQLKAIHALLVSIVKRIRAMERHSQRLEDRVDGMEEPPEPWQDDDEQWR